MKKTVGLSFICYLILVVECSNPEPNCIVVHSKGNGTTEPSGQICKEQQSFEIKAMPNPGYEFLYWSIEGGVHIAIDDTNAASTYVNLNDPKYDETVQAVIMAHFSSSAKPPAPEVLYCDLTPVTRAWGTEISMGTFQGGGGGFITIASSKDVMHEGGASLKAEINCPNGAWAGFFIQAGAINDVQTTFNMETYLNGSLDFHVKAPSKLEIGIRSGDVGAGLETSKIVLQDGSYGFTANNEWCHVKIPLNLFKGPKPRADFDQIKILFVASKNDKTGPTMDKEVFYFDCIRWVAEVTE